MVRNADQANERNRTRFGVRFLDERGRTEVWIDGGSDQPDASDAGKLVGRVSTGSGAGDGSIITVLNDCAAMRRLPVPRDVVILISNSQLRLV